MKKERIIKFISIVIYLILIVRLVPNSSPGIDGYQRLTQSSKALLSSGVFHTDVLYNGREGQKPLIQKVQLKNTSICIPRISIDDITVSSFSFQELPFDYRKVIRQSVPHYFNGSKYKNNHSAI